MNNFVNFDKCVEVIKKLSNCTISSYICPICGNLFDKESVENKTLTIDHVPPKSIGGKPLVLTCESCNNDLGSKLDSQIKNHQDFVKSVKTISTGNGHLTQKNFKLVCKHIKNDCYSVICWKMLLRPSEYMSTKSYCHFCIKNYFMLYLKN